MKGHGVCLQVVEAALKDACMDKDQVDWLVLHQANQRILDSAATRLGVPSDRVISNLAGRIHIQHILSLYLLTRKFSICPPLKL